MKNIRILRGESGLHNNASRGKWLEFALSAKENDTVEGSSGRFFGLNS